ncbi:MAG: CDP-alcohol phosphatidyltransferase family protein [Oscillospiraceae bacterium]|nr:CDP-alcohol phosphatidyltransferase family protein [Oscillospiraceae bacterium]MBR3610467.1 CDP-alcohol phosphatidyltransferase family protein [Oscillospiraceae bacterium]MBR3953284.1 CDP-alcohol phosphatidyltransferase family protein [Oscillospiraceae bacterium]
MKLIGFYNYTVILTYMGAAAAICGIFFSASGYPLWGVICLLFAGLTDMFDGKVASTMKRNEAEKAFGIQIDSLCDLVSFGVLPVAIGYGIGLDGGFFYASGAIYLLCAIIRLAYFNVDEAQRQKTETGRRKIYYGLPVTSAAIIFPMVFGLKSLLGEAMPVIYQILLYGVAAAFIIKFKLAKPNKKGIPLLVIIGLAIAVLVITSGM